jgi:hypothetical protein
MSSSGRCPESLLQSIEAHTWHDGEAEAVPT